MNKINTSANLGGVNKEKLVGLLEKLTPGFPAVTRATRWLSNMLLPSSCVLCGAKGTEMMDLCHACKLDLPWLQNPCKRCAIPLSGESDSQLCATCLQNPPFFAQTIALFEYRKPIDKLIMGLKFQKKLVYARLLSELFAERLSTLPRESLPEVIMPVPLHKQRLKERGFNQTVELTRLLAKQYQIPIDLQSCQRIKATDAQAALQSSDREGNIKGAFQIKKKIRPKHIAVFDDVVTTGQTVTELSRILHQEGVERIDIWCCARTNLSKSSRNSFFD